LPFPSETPQKANSSAGFSETLTPEQIAFC